MRRQSRAIGIRRRRIFAEATGGAGRRQSVLDPEFWRNRGQGVARFTPGSGAAQQNVCHGRYVMMKRIALPLLIASALTVAACGSDETTTGGGGGGGGGSSSG